jgi:hypothetical protein
MRRRRPAAGSVRPRAKRAPRSVAGPTPRVSALTGDRGFESISLQRRVINEPGRRRSRSALWATRWSIRCSLGHLIAALPLALSACTNPYDPVQRGLGGGILGAASGAAIGAAAGGGPGAALGAAIGGATGIVGGVASTPPPPRGTYYGYPAYGPPAYGYPGYAQPGYGYQGYSGYPAYSAAPGYGYPTYSGQPAYPSAGYGSPSNSGYPAYSGPPASTPPSYPGQPAYPGAPGYGFQGPPPNSPYSGSGYGNPVAGYPGDRPSEDWSPGAEYAIEPAS